MNNIIPNPINEKKIKKVLALVLTLCCLLPVIVNITCLTPLLYSLENNTLYKGTAVSLTVKYVSDLLVVLSFASVYSIIIFSKALLNKKTTVVVSILYVALLLFKIPASLLMVIPVYGEIILADILMLTFYFILDSLQFALILIFVTITIKSYLRSINLIIRKNSKNAPALNYILPISRYFDWYNPLLRSAFYSSLTVVGFRAFSRLISSIGMVPPETFKEVMTIVVDYLSDFVFGAAAYIIAVVVFNVLYDALTKVTNKDKKHDNDGNESNNLKDDKNKADDTSSSALFDD